MIPANSPIPFSIDALKDSFRESGRRFYASAAEQLTHLQNPEAGGAPRNGTASSMKAIQTRNGRYGETKLQTPTIQTMKSKGFSLNQSQNAGKA